MSTVFKWLADNKEFSEQYARAKQVQADYYADEIIDIADDGTNDWMEVRDKEGENVIGWRENGESIRRSVLRVDARKWVAAKLLPKKYGEKPIEVSGLNGSPIQAAIAVTFVKTNQPE